jgi:hypothetical protein
MPWTSPVCSSHPAGRLRFKRPVLSGIPRLCLGRCLRLGRGCESPQFLQKCSKLPLLALRQDRHGRFEIRGVAAESVLHHGSAFRTQLQHPGSSVGRRRRSKNQAPSLESVHHGSHRAERERHLGLDLADRERTFVQQSLQRREIRETQARVADASLGNVVESTKRPQQYEPETRGVDRRLHAQAWRRPACAAGEDAVIERSSENAPAPRIKRNAVMAITRR